MDYAQFRCQDRGEDLVTINEERSERAQAVGRLLGDARRALGLSKREAAKRAGIAEVTWRQYESGRRQVDKDLYVPVSPTDENLERAALAMGLLPLTVFEAAGRAYEQRTVLGTQAVQTEIANPGSVRVIPGENGAMEARIVRIEATVGDLADRFTRLEEAVDSRLAEKDQ